MSKNLFYYSSLSASTQVALRRAGYQTVDELAGATAETLSKELGINIADCETLISTTQAPREIPLSQSVASLSRTGIFKCSYLAVNTVLGGGLPRGHILEISGPPGSFKEAIALDFVRIFSEANEGVIFVDMQGMTSPKAISGVLAATALHNSHELICYARIHTLPDLVVFMHNLLVELHPTTGLLVLNSIYFPFQSHPDLPPRRRTALLNFIRQNLLQACASSNLTAGKRVLPSNKVVVTSQMATKMLKADGSAATFDNGVKAIMMPQLAPDYLPSGRSYRLMIIPHSRVAGVVRLLSSPSGHNPDDVLQENYTFVSTITV